MMHSIQLSNEQWECMCKHVRSCYPEEGCGFLGGECQHVRIVIPVTNALHGTTRFRMDPEEQLAGLRRIEDEGFELIGIFHSHPHGPPEPSESDVDEWVYEETFYLLWFIKNNAWECRGFQLLSGKIVEIPLEMVVG